MPLDKTQLARTPKQTQALLGLTRTAVELDDQMAAREAFAALMEFWVGAELPVDGLVQGVAKPIRRND